MVAIARYRDRLSAIQNDASFSWSSVSLGIIADYEFRLEAGYFSSTALNARSIICQSKFGYTQLRSLISKCDYPGRFKRAYVSSGRGDKFYLPSQINELLPRATKYISSEKTTNRSELIISKNTLLVTRSGTVGNCTLASKSLIGGVFSDDVIRIKTNDIYSLGFLYVYLKSEVGRIIVQSNKYGAVQKHIEPSHLLELPVPNAPPALQNKIHNLVESSFDLRDSVNNLVAKAQNELGKALNLFTVEKYEPTPNGENDLVAFSISAAKLNNRFEANYHNCLATNIINHLKKSATSVLYLRDRKLTEKIILPGRFKRYYVSPTYGVPFIGGKEILELDPRGKKYLSLEYHGARIASELTLRENMILVTCSGTIGKVNIVPTYWDGWTGSQHILRAVPADKGIAGYLYAWLSSEWALPLIKRHAYGAVVQEIDQNHLASVPVPLISADTMERINDLILEANQKKYLAFQKEQQALRIFDQEILGRSIQNEKRQKRTS